MTRHTLVSIAAAFFVFARCGLACSCAVPEVAAAYADATDVVEFRVIASPGHFRYTVERRASFKGVQPARFEVAEEFALL